jgi:hypothetical protein
MECGDQVLRNFLNGLVIHLRGTKENPKSKRRFSETQSTNTSKDGAKERPEFKVKPRDEEKSRGDQSPQMQLKKPSKNNFQKGITRYK